MYAMWILIVIRWGKGHQFPYRFFILSMFASLFSRPLRCLYRSPVFSVRQFHSSPFVMSNVSVQLTAPNGHSYTQPIGLFINNEFVAAKSGEKFATVNPSYVQQESRPLILS